jgi:hypothetical protein
VWSSLVVGFFEENSVLDGPLVVKRVGLDDVLERCPGVEFLGAIVGLGLSVVDLAATVVVFSTLLVVFPAV